MGRAGPAFAYNLGLAFAARAAETPERDALRYPDGRIVAFGELDRRANQLARMLRERGIGRGDVVALLNRKSPDALAAMIGCLKLGAIYTNLDVSSPAERLAKILASCRPKLLLRDRRDANSEAEQHPEIGAPEILDLEDADTRAQIDALPDGEPEGIGEVTGADPAYIMFTSGSTGVPKGAVMSHANVLSFVDWGRARLAVVPDDCFTNVNPIYFDNSVFDFYVSLWNGASLCPITSELTQRPRDLVAAIGELGCSIWFSVPSMLVYLLTMRALGADDFPKVRAIVFGGEGFPKRKLRELHALLGERATLVNVYGPTECTCICSAHDITEQDLEDLSELAPLGRIAENFGYRIDPVEDSDPDFGELLLYGPNVGLGYFDDPERSTAAFVQDPGEGRFLRRVYRSGDLVQRAPNGDLYFKGRVDNQIKHMGYRIELEEIEAGLASLPYVHEAGVVYLRSGDGPGQIVGFVSADEEDEKQILDDLRAVLPPYMIPRKIHRMPGLPKNRNGKIDRRALREGLESRS